MIDPNEIGVVYGGGSSDTPARDYVVVGGTSSTEGRDYVIVPGRRLSATTGAISVVGYGNFWLDKYKLKINPSVIGVNGGAQDQFSLGSRGILLNASILTALYQYLLNALTSSIALSAGSQNPWDTKPGTIRVIGYGATLTAIRQPGFTTGVITVNGYKANLLFNNLGTGVIQIASLPTSLNRTRRLKISATVIEVIGWDAVFKNNYLAGRTGIIYVKGYDAEFRKLLSGFLPDFPPTSVSFSPPKYGIEKIYTMSGASSRSLMCSRPSNASLTIEYENISDNDAYQVAAAYDSSFGTELGFGLPEAITGGQAPELAGYVKLLNSQSKWFFDDRPAISSVMKGVSRMTLQLRSRVKV